MRQVQARVRQGRLLVDEPTSLPDGTVIELVAVDDGDELDDAERAELHAALGAAWVSANRGETQPAEDLIARLRRAP